MYLFFTMLMVILMSFFSTAVLSYISMAIMIGPWIESTIVLIASLIMMIFAYRWAYAQRCNALVYITAGGSVGGIIATGCGFAFPTLYFLDPVLFSQWIAHPLFFCTVMASLVITAGGLGIVLANALEDRLIAQDKLSFPIGELAYKLISVQDNAKKALQLAGGFFGSLVYSMVNKFMLLPRFVQILPSLTFQHISFCGISIPLLELPTLYAIGFIAGHVIAIPLLVGILINIILLTPAYSCYFSYLTYTDFSFAFASGMVLYGALMSFFDLPKVLKGCWGKIDFSYNRRLNWQVLDWMQAGIIALSIIAFLSYFKFGILSQLYLIIFTLICAYQLALIGGKIGMAPMGKFATFVMVPGILLFGYTSVQVMLVSTFVEVCGGVIVDILFGRKMACLAQVDKKKIVFFQWIGLIASALSIGIFFLLLIKHLGLGSGQLIAQRAHMRALLVGVQKFDFFALVLGALIGAILKDLKVNPVMVLGGILMPIHWSFVLVVSGLTTYITKNPDDHYPFWSGVFAANSLWMILQAII